MIGPPASDPELATEPARDTPGGGSLRLTREHWLLIVAGWLLLSLFSAWRLRAVMHDLDWATALLYGLPDGLIWAVLTPFAVILARRYPLPTPRPWRSALGHLVGGSLVAVAHTQLDALVNAVREYWTTGDSLLGLLSAKLLIYGFHFNLLIYALIAGAAMYLARVQRLREEERRADRLRIELAEARLAALRAQIRPHFLFNALHTVGSLIERDPASGRRILRQLGDLLRSSLSVDEGEEIPLRQELELTRAYLDIEQVRFADRLTVRIEAEEDLLDFEIPMFLLQPLVDNAIRHGISRSAEPGEVHIRVRRLGARLEIRVRDTGPGAEGSKPGAGIGLASVRERLRAKYGEDHGLEIESEPGFAVTLNMPCPRPVDLADAPVSRSADTAGEIDTGRGAMDAEDLGRRAS